MSELPLSQQAAPDHVQPVFEKLWSIYPRQGKARTVGLKANSKRRTNMTPMERCKEATKVALRKVSADMLVGALESYVERQLAEEDGKYIKGLEWWLEQGQWEVEDFTTGNARNIEPAARPGKHWRHAQGQVLTMLNAMSEQGCPDDVLDKLFGDGIGVTHVNRSKGMPPTAVLKSTMGITLWHNAASGYADRAGYNRYPYSPDYVKFARRLRERESEPV